MSADNWAECPQCKRWEELDFADAEVELKNSYGKVSAEEYLAKRDEVYAEKDSESTLREDWELGTDEDGEFYVIYRCHCDICKFKFEYKYDHKIPISPRPQT